MMMRHSFETLLAMAVLCVQLSSQSPVFRRRTGDHHHNNHAHQDQSATTTTTSGLDTAAAALPVYTLIQTASEIYNEVTTIYVDATAIPTAQTSAPVPIATATPPDADSTSDADVSSDSAAATSSPSSASISTSAAPATTAVEPSSEVSRPSSSSSIPIPVASTVAVPATTAAAAPTTRSSTVASASASATSSFWEPAAGATWQIELTGTVSDIDYSADVFDLDLFDTPAATITALHALGKKVICYFSAGSLEDWRSDAASFTAADKGLAMDGWAGEWWLDTRTANVRSIMAARIAAGAAKGCDGVDPDNVDGYDQNQAGVGLTEADAVDYVTFLANTAHAAGVSVGLKNAAGLVDQVLPLMQWHVNEQCLEFDECHLFQPFISAGKPVFHIEYPDDAGSVIAASVKADICNGNSTTGFSTVMKTLELTAWVDNCATTS